MVRVGVTGANASAALKSSAGVMVDPSAWFRPRRMISLSTLNADVARSMLMRLAIRSSAPAATSFNWKVDPLAPMTLAVAEPSDTNAN